MTSAQERKIEQTGCDVRFDNLTRQLYATDASIYQIEPAGVAFPQSALMVKRSYLDANREKVTSFVKALIEGLYLVKKHKALAIQVMKKYIRADDEVYGIGYDYFLARYGDDLLTLPDRKGLEFVIAQTAKSNPKAKGQSPESLRLLEPSVLEEIKKSGFIDKVKK